MNSTKPGAGRFFDDVSRLMTNAMGVAQGARDEAETALKSRIDRWLADRNLVTRDEFEAVREMAIKARTENAELRAMIAAMGGAAAGHAGHQPGGSVAQNAASTPAQAPHLSGAQVPPVSQTPHGSSVQAPASGSTGYGSAGTGAVAPDAAPAQAPHLTEADAPASTAMPEH